MSPPAESQPARRSDKQGRRFYTSIKICIGTKKGQKAHQTYYIGSHLSGNPGLCDQYSTNHNPDVRRVRVQIAAERHYADVPGIPGWRFVRGQGFCNLLLLSVCN